MLLTIDVISRMLDHATQSIPNASCGVVSVAADNALSFIPVRNLKLSPTEWQMDPIAVTRIDRENSETGAEIAAIVRAYPNQGSAALSNADLAGAMFDGHVRRPESLEIVVALGRQVPEIRAYRVHDGGFVDEEPVEIVGGEPLTEVLEGWATVPSASPTRPTHAPAPVRVANVSPEGQASPIRRIMGILGATVGVVGGIALLLFFLAMLLALNNSLVSLAESDAPRSWWWWPGRIVIGVVSFSLLAMCLWGIVVGLLTGLVNVIAFALGRLLAQLFRRSEEDRSFGHASVGVAELGRSFFNLFFWFGAGWYAILAPFLIWIPVVSIAIALGVLLLVWTPAVAWFGFASGGRKPN